MKVIRGLTLGLVSVVSAIFGTQAFGQIVINEVVKEQRNGLNDGASVNPDTREFVELYNAGASAVDITGWTLGTSNLATGAADATDTIPSGIIAPGSFYVIGSSGVPNVSFTPITGEIWTDVAPRVLELRNNVGAMQDAVAYEVYRTGATRLNNATAEQLAQIGSGFQGELFSLDEGAPNVSASWSRYRDGRDTNKNGQDFGMLPLTPGASNNIALNASHTFPNVDSMNAGDVLSQYHASFVLPTVIEPTAVSAWNPRAIPASPQGGKAIVAWDPTGGGNAVFSKELVNSYDVYAYFDTTPIGVAPTTLDEEWESSIYGIGATDAFFRNPDPTVGIPQAPSGSALEPVSRNSSTGIGWLYQQFEDGSGAPAPAFSKLMLYDFGDSGDSEVAGEWVQHASIDMTGVASGWYRLSLSYDPNTDLVTGTFNNQQFTFTLPYDLFGTFFVGYREAITGAPPTSLDKHNPPTYDLFVAGVPGDYNGNGKVDGADYVIFRDHVGTAFQLPNEVSGITPGQVTPEDYAAWRSRFGNTSGSGAGQLAGTVPEPSTIALIALGLVAMAASRGRRMR